jgi:hypothetical protein
MDQIKLPGGFGPDKSKIIVATEEMFSDYPAKI